MRILMLGWEFPPYISGGLGTACRGLTDGLRRANARVLFVLPRSTADTAATDTGACGGVMPDHVRFTSCTEPGEQVAITAVASDITTPYPSSPTRPRAAARLDTSPHPNALQADPSSTLRVMGVGAEDGYEGDLVGKIRAYAERCVVLARRELFDVIHAHDWMTYPAAMAISRLSGRPMVAHVHATEFDRSSDPTGGTIFGIERRGMHAAARVLAVSHRTRNVIVNRYGVSPGRVTVVHNGIDRSSSPAPRNSRRPPTVLFLGRITRQKGPRYFLRAAARVVSRVPDARFVVAGSGDELDEMTALAAELGIAERVTFAGFLRGGDVDRAYDNADVYVMPSVSEPFGLSALEAAARGVPVIVSNTSGVAEVLRQGSLKVDFWDVEMMARMIITILQNPGLGSALARVSAREMSGVTWDAAARRCIHVYYEVTGERAHGVSGEREAAVPALAGARSI